MKHLAQLVLALFLVGSFGYAGEKEVAPNVDAILAVQGKYAMAHACPVGPFTALTVAHVMDIRPFDRNMPLFPFRAENTTWSGTLMPVGVEHTTDLGYTTPFGQTPFPVFYPIAAADPQPGDRLYWIGYNYGGEKEALAPELYSAEVIRVVAGTVVLKKATKPGSSGSCILNSAGEVVALIAWGKELENGREITMGVLVTKPWVDMAKVEERVSEARKVREGE